MTPSPIVDPVHACIRKLGSARSCGTASTYNNGPCRGPECTAAIRQYRAELRQRSAAYTKVPTQK